MTVDRFFLEWLPEQLGSMQLGQDVAAHVSLQVEVAGSCFTILAEPRQVIVRKEPTERPTFRLRLDQTTFDRLLAPAVETSLDHGPALKILSMDAETLELMGSVPGCLEVKVRQDDTVLSLVFGPGASSEVGCVIECDFADLKEVQQGRAQPLELLMNGKLRIEGDPQIAMALGGVLV